MKSPRRGLRDGISKNGDAGPDPCCAFEDSDEIITVDAASTGMSTGYRLAYVGGGGGDTVELEYAGGEAQAASSGG
ncbi:hypothetical protein DJ031_00065 [bacterium endosymbiont of Escarpia laminata]|nr:MAG: hypothetical protein DJ031_00065 [bacterium endosymbiont of Escarpia laminata]